MSLEKAYLRAVTETKEQFDTCLVSDAIELIYIDSAAVPSSQYKKISESCHAAGKYIGLRTPHIWRTEAEDFFNQAAEDIKAAGFDAFLFRNFEGFAFFKMNGLIENAEIILDNTVYAFNHSSEEFIRELADDARLTITLSEELNKAELRNLNAKLKSETELKVYGHTCMMVSAQCIRKTTLGCDKCQALMYLKDRKGAMLPVKNHCTWCYNEILNSVPTVLYDMENEIKKIGPDYIRYDFTIEDRSEIERILNDKLYIPKEFTRGHFKRGVE